MKTTARNDLLLLTILFIGLRLTWFSLEGDLFFTKFPNQDDAPTYRAMADIFRGHGTYADHGISPVTRVPLWPLLLATIQSVAGPSNHAAAFVVLHLTQLTIIFLVYLFLAQRHRRSTALISALLLTAFVDFALYGFLLRSETLFAALLLGATLLLLQTVKQPTTPRLILLGILLGLATLTRPIGLLAIIPAGAAVLWYAPLPKTENSVKVALLIVVFTLTLSPWLIRNYARTNHLLLQQDTGNIYYATLPGGHYNSVSSNTVAPNADQLTELELDRELVRQAKQRITEHPSIWITNSAHNFFYRLWAMGYIDTHLRYFEYIDNTGGYHKAGVHLAQSLNVSNPANTIPAPYHLYLIANNILGFSLIPLSLLGLLLLPALDRDRRIIMLIILTLWLGTALFSFSGSRYMIPLLPLLVLVIPAFPAAARRLHSA